MCSKDLGNSAKNKYFVTLVQILVKNRNFDLNFRFKFLFLNFKYKINFSVKNLSLSFSPMIFLARPKNTKNIARPVLLQDWSPVLFSRLYITNFGHDFLQKIMTIKQLRL